MRAMRPVSGSRNASTANPSVTPTEHSYQWCLRSTVFTNLKSTETLVPGGSYGDAIAAQPARAAARFAHAAFEVVVFELDVEPEAVRASAALLSDVEQQKADRLVFERDRRRFTVARAKLRKLLAARLDMPPAAVEFRYGARGKPALTGRCAESDLRFNVSHTEDVAVCAFSRGREVGIDIEAVRAIPDAEEIAARFFSRRENEAYLGLDPDDRPLGFFNCWTRKEAFVKALGDGLYYPLDRFDVSLSPGDPARILRVENTRGSDCAWSLHSFLPGPGLAGAIVVEKLASELASDVAPERIAVRSLPHR